MKKLFLLFVFLIMAAFGMSADIYVVSVDKADVREADSESADIIGSLRNGMEINVSKIDGGYCQIDFMGVKGFVSVNDLKFKSRAEKTSGQDENVVDKTKGFVSNTSRKVADGVSGFSGKIFGKKKHKKQDETEVEEEESVASAPAESRLSQETSGNPASDGIVRSEEQAAGITADEYTRRVTEAEANASSVTEEGAAGVIYIFDNFKYSNGMIVRFNGNVIPLPNLELKKESKHGLDTYRRAVTKIVVKNQGRIIIARDFTWYGKPYHDELTLDVADGDVYYVELLHGINSKLNLMDTKDGEKEYQKVSKDTKNWKVNPPQYYEE